MVAGRRLCICEHGEASGFERRGWHRPRELHGGLRQPNSLVVVAGGIGAAWAINIYNEAPALDTLKPVRKGTSSSIYAADGSLIGYIRSNNIRQPVKADELPATLKEATVAIEARAHHRCARVDERARAMENERHAIEPRPRHCRPVSAVCFRP